MQGARSRRLRTAFWQVGAGPKEDFAVWLRIDGDRIRFPRGAVRAEVRRQSESCEPRGGRYSVEFSVLGYESDEALTVSQVLGDEARAVYLKALPKQGQGEGGE